MRLLKICTVVLLLAIAAAPAFGADLVSVSTSVSQPTVSPGGTNEGKVLIENHTNLDVRARLAVSVVYADGSVQRLSDVGDPGVLPPGGGYFVSIYFIIPDDAAPGPATFFANVTAASGGLREEESSSAPFEVVY